MALKCGTGSVSCIASPWPKSRSRLPNASDALAVRGPSSEAPKLAALAPVALTDGRFILGVEVLGDPLQAEDWAFLSTLPQVAFSTVANLMPPGSP
jgi:hypothetical protein